MASPYRFDAEPQTATGMGRSRTGLSAVTAGATSGGEGYRRSALLPGSRGFAAANFGAAPRTDYVAPVTPEPETPVPPTPAPETPPTAPEQAPVPESTHMGAEGGGAVGEMNDAVNNQAAGGYLADVLDGLGLSTGQYGGPAGDMATGPELAGLGAQAEQNVDAMQGSGFGDARGLATGGRVGPQHLRKGMPMHGAKKGGLGAVSAGKKPFMGGYAGGGSVMAPNYAAGGPVDQVAGPDPSGPDDGYAALDQGEFVVKKDQAQRPDYGPILEQMNQGTYAPDGSQAHEGAESPGMEAGEGDDDLDLDFGAQGNYPPSTAESNTPDDMMQRLAMMPPEQSQALSQAMADPMVMSALFALLGPAFMGVMSALQGQGQQTPGMGGGGMQPPGMLGISPDRAGMRPPGGGLGSIQA